MTSGGAWNPDKIAAYEEAYEAFTAQVRFASKETGDTVLAANRYQSQKWFLRAIWDGLADDIHDFSCLKSRQLGITTEARALGTFWMGIHDGLRGAMVFDTADHKEEARLEIEMMIQGLPRSVRFPRVKTLNRYMMTLENGSLIRFMSAGVRTSKSSGVLGRSSGINMLLACMAPGTLIVLADGAVKPIEEVVAGDQLLTHTGAGCRVLACAGAENPGGSMLEITPWLGCPVRCTADHKIATTRGLVRAADLRLDDEITMPIRKITAEVDGAKLPETPIRTQSGGKQSAGSGAYVEFDREFGFAMGYYLAEGSITYQRRGERYYDAPSGIVFSRHRNESRFSDRAVSALRPYLSGDPDYESSLTTVVRLYGSSLASWIEEVFGARDTKCIPDVVWSWGTEFCLGLITGLIAGDGSKKPASGVYNRMFLSSTRSTVALQARDLVASLGMGWASASNRPAGDYYGRNCKSIWTIIWNGITAADLRELIDLPVYERSYWWVDKYRQNGDFICLKIRKIKEVGGEPVMYDLAVDHADHTYRTPWMCVSNSELCSWDNDEGIIALKQSLAEEYENRLYLKESTGRGFNTWHDMWQEALADDLNQRTIFLGWWLKDTQVIRYGSAMWERYGSAEPTKDELSRIAEVKKRYGWEVTREQLAWYRRKMDPARERDKDDPEDSMTMQEQPWTENECFLVTGSTFFDAVKLSERMAQAVPYKYQSYKFWPGRDFFASEIKPALTWRECQLKLWEEPVPDASYIVAADPAYGHDERNDRSAIQVLRCYADCTEQVCEYASASTPTHQFAWLIVSLSAYYGLFSGTAVYNIVELNGPGEAVWREMDVLTRAIRTGHYATVLRERGLTDMVNNIRQYIYTRSDSMGTGHSYHWKTSQQLKVAIMERVRDFIHNGSMLVRSQETLEEARAVTRNGDTIKAEGKKHDDRIFTLALAGRCWEERVQRPLMTGGRTKAADTAKRALSMADQFQLFRQYQLADFFKVKLAQRSRLQQAAMRRVRWDRRR